MLETQENLNDDGKNIDNNYNNKDNVIRCRFPKFMKVRQFFAFVVKFETIIKFETITTLESEN